MNSSKRNKTCWRCAFLAWKHRRWLDLDWLYVTVSPKCSKHRSTAIPQLRDLADDFMTFSQAEVEMRFVRNEEARKLLYDIAKRWESDVDGASSILRDKAKTVIGLTSLAFTLMFAGAGYLAGAASSFPTWAFTIESILLSLVALHLARSLLISIQVFTTEDVIRPSMQEYIQALSMASESDDKNKMGQVYLDLSAYTISAANIRNKKILPRINDMVISQTAIRYGIIYMVALVIAHLTGTIFWNATTTASSPPTSQTPSAKTKEPVTEKPAHSSPPAHARPQLDAGPLLSTGVDGGINLQDGGLPTIPPPHLTGDGGTFSISVGSDAGALGMDGGPSIPPP